MLRRFVIIRCRTAAYHGAVHTSEGDNKVGQESYERILANPRFQELTAKRSRFAWMLSAIMLVVFYGFILVVAFQPALLATPIGPGWTLSIGVPIGAGIVILAFLLTWIYVARANAEFEALNREVLEELTR